MIATVRKRQARTIISLLGLAVLVLGACSSPSGGGQAPPAGKSTTASVSAGDAQQGRKLLIEKGCGACHTARGVPEATGSIGPTLTGMASKPRIADTLPYSPENLKRWIINPPAVKPGTAMPPLGLSDKDADDLVTFLDTLK